MTVWMVLFILFALCVALIDIAGIMVSAIEEDRMQNYFDELDIGNDCYPIDKYDCYKTDEADEQKEGD